MYRCICLWIVFVKIQLTIRENFIDVLKYFFPHLYIALTLNLIIFLTLSFVYPRALNHIAVKK